MMRKAFLRLGLVLFSCLGIATAHAGGPLDLGGAAGHTPVTYTNGGQGITINYDQGGLGSRSKAQADALIDQAIGLWNNVPTATVTLTRGADLPIDVTVANYSTYLGHYSDGINPIIYDTDGSITDALLGVGSKNSILGFAGSAYYSGSATYAEGEAVINGALAVSDNTLTIVLAHELGHFIGLDHTQLDNTQGLASSNYALMYPIAYRTLVSLHEDDTATVSALYPAADLATTYGVLSGKFTKTDATAILGSNIWAKESATGKVYSSVSDYLKQGTGYFRMLLPPGSYTLNAESIQTNFTGGSGVGPYSATPTSASFQAPNPITPITFQNATPGTTYAVNITAGCNADITFKLDGSGSVNSTTCVNRAPVAQNAAVSTKQNTPLNSAVVATDPDNDPLTYRIVAQGTRGTATMNATNGAFTYTPQAGVSGTDSFTFAANDSKVDSNIATVSITIIANAAPTITSLTATPQTLLDTGTSQLQVVANDPDAGPSPLSYVWSITSGGGSLSSTTIANPVYTPPNVSATTPVTINVVVFDGAASVNQSITLTVNDAGTPPPPPPMLSLIISADNANEVYLNGVLLGTGNDWTKSSSYSAALQSGTNVLAVKGIDAGGVAAMIAELAWPGASAVSDATWKVSTTAPAGWANIGFNDSAWPVATSYGQYGVVPWNKNVTGFPSASSAKWIWSADNNNDNTVFLRYTFMVGSVPLAISTGTLANGVAGAAYTQTLAATGGTAPYTWSIATGSLPAGLNLNTATGVISGTPSTAGTSNFSVQVQDNVGATTSKALTLNIAAANVAPTISSLTATPQTLLDTATSQLQVVANDPDAGPSPLSYVWSITSGGGSLSSTTIANPVYTPPNVSATTPVTINVVVFDGAASVNQSITLTVNDAGTPPPPPPMLSLIISADNANEVYLNGVLLGTGNDWTKSSSYSAALQSGTNVLAVKGIDAGGVAAMIAELAWPGASAVSDATWKVSTTAPAGWANIGFNDSAWPVATSYGQYGVAPWNKNVAGFPSASTAKWIWSADNNNDNTVYLRYTFTVP
jgi:hypothetical protein